MSNNKIQDAFRITAFLDAARWESAGNYNLINFCSDSLSDDEKILTHWLCYVTDRQMPFDRIWSIGGFVFPELVHELKTRSDFDLLDPSKPDKSFFIRAQDYQDKDRYGFKDKRLDGFLFVSHKEVGSNTRLHEYEFKNDTRPYFIPRYYPSDYFSLLSTFVVLQEYDNSLATFVISILNRNMGDPTLVPKLVFALYLLTYHDIGQVKKGDIKFNVMLQKTTERCSRVMQILKNDGDFDQKFDVFREKQIYQQKRAWCSVRDFFKSPQFNQFFENALRSHNFKDIERLKDKSLLLSFELPGDVWNNNPKFRKCLMDDTRYADEKRSMPKVIREMYVKECITNAYPEQFDITFDFVPRMCDEGNCSICPYGLLNKRATDFEKVCSMSEGKYCPVILSSCNYRYPCSPRECPLIALQKKESLTS